jgi:hypothetical protein
MLRPSLLALAGALALCTAGHAQAPDPPLDANAVVAEVRRIIAARYVLPERRPALDAVLAEGLASGRYAVTDPAVLAQRVDADLERVGSDHHLGFKLDPKQAGTLAAVQRRTAPDRSGYERQVRQVNHGITELRLLPGNVRYMAYEELKWIGAETKAALDDALRFLGGGEAIIIDLRTNGGGSGDAADRIAAHFLSAGTALYTYYEEGVQQGAQVLAVDPPAGRLLGKPLYLLTSAETASAAEALAGIIAGHGVGEVVGENTAGAGYENTLVPIDGRFVLSVSIGRVVIAPTGRDWEKVGITPTIRTAVPAALDVAHMHALRRIATTAPAEERPGLEARAEWLSARAEPRSPALPLAAYAGTYGERTVTLVEGTLHYWFGDRPQRVLVPLGEHRFTFEHDPEMHVRFVVDGDRTTAVEVLPVGAPAQGRYARTP